MSIQNYDVKETYTGTGSLDEYSFDFKITALTQLLVVVVDDNGDEIQRVRGDDTSFLDSVTFDAINGGGTVTLQANLPAGYDIILLLANDEPVQDYTFRNKTSFTLRRFEDALDNLAGAIQRLVYRGKQSFRIHDLDDEETFNTQFPPGITDQGGKVLVVNDDGDGLDFGPTTQSIFDAAAAAEASAEAAAESEADAQIAEDASTNAALEAAESALLAQLLLFDGSVNVSDLDSPVTIDEPTYGSKIVFIDAEDGNVDIQLGAIASYPAGFKVQFVRTDTSANTVTILPDGSETIDTEASWLLPSGLAVIFSPSSTVATDWTKKFIGVTNGGGALPPSGNAGDYLEHDGSAPLWQSGVFAGFSARYSATLALNSVKEAIDYIFQFSYLGPLISLAASGSGTVREKGASVASTTLTATTTRRSDDIAKVEFFRAGVEIAENDPATNPGGGAEVYVDSVPFSDNISFFARATDDGTSGGPTVVTSNTVSFVFVYPYYYGADVPGIAAAAVAALTKDIRVSTASLNRVFTSDPGDVFYFAYPASYGALTSILDENGFETFGDWTLRTENITGLDGNPVSYRIYEFDNVSAGVTTNYTFIR